MSTKKLLLVFLAVISCILVSCGQEKTEIPESEEVSETTTEITETSAEIHADSGTETVTVAEPYRQHCGKTIRNPDKPEITSILLSGDCADKITSHAKVKDLYKIDYLHSGVVGLVGIPVEITYDDEITSPVISFTYNRDELRGIPEKNLIMLHYSEEDSFYNTMENAVLDTDKCIVSAEMEEEGVYMLADAYQWYDCWGVDVSGFAYDKDVSAYSTDWERENDTGDIMTLADKEWAMNNAPDFRVSTPEQLASVVWYVNGVDGNVSITLENDIDLSGYKWKSMGWSGGNSMSFSGLVDGQNHTINGLNISEEYCDTGFIGYGLGVTVRDINFTDACVSATGCVGIVGGEIYYKGEWENIHVSGVVSGGKDDYASIVGRETDITFTDCTADVTVNEETFEYLSYRQKRIDDAGDVEAFTITLGDDMIVSRDEPDGDYLNLCWNVYRDGEKKEYTGAEDKISLDVYNKLFMEGDYEIYLTAYINGTYVKVSNVIEYHSEGYDFRWSD